MAAPSDSTPTTEPRGWWRRTDKLPARSKVRDTLEVKPRSKVRDTMEVPPSPPANGDEGVIRF